MSAAPSHLTHGVVELEALVELVFSHRLLRAAARWLSVPLELMARLAACGSKSILGALVLTAVGFVRVAHAMMELE